MVSLGFDARGSNTGPGFAIPGGVPLCRSCYGSVSRKHVRVYADLTTKLLHKQLSNDSGSVEDNKPLTDVDQC